MLRGSKLMHSSKSKIIKMGGMCHFALFSLIQTPAKIKLPILFLNDTK